MKREVTPTRPTKRPRKDSNDKSGHPLGVLPLGNLLFPNHPQPRTIGNLWSLLPHAVIQHFINELSPAQVAVLSQVCKTFYAFCASEEYWRTAVLDRFKGEFIYRHSWRITYAEMESKKSVAEARVDCSGVFSDVIYRPFQCSLASQLQEWLSKETIPRVAASELSLTEFKEQYEKLNRPVIIIGLDWQGRFTVQKLMEHKNTMFKAENVHLSLEKYLNYAENCSEESPLYIFDKEFLNNNDMGYSAPEYFQDDLFALLGEGRPDWRWIVVGPRGSGSGWHKDPNNTSAWNGVIKGSKRWWMCPPRHPPAGVYTSHNEAEVTSPVSIGEWLFSFYRSRKEILVQGTCHEGEVIFVPSGWWHMVLNTGEGVGVAVTHNFCSQQTLPRVMNFLNNKSDQVSGCRGTEDTLPERFQEALHVANIPFESQDSLWGQLKDGGSFSFSFS